MSSHRFFLSAVLLLAVLLHSPLFAQSNTVRDRNVEARLLSSHSTIQPGQTFTIGLQLEMDPTWHTYWINPGETGLPTTLKLDLPEGFVAGDLQFPIPKKFITDFGYGVREAGYGYETSVVHPVTITAPADLEPGRTVTLKGAASWLMCDPNTCIPGKADLSLSLQVGAESVASSESGLLELYTKRLPRPLDAPAAVTLEGNQVVLKTTLPQGTPAAGATLHFYPLRNLVFDAFADAAVTVAGEDTQVIRSNL